MQYDEMEFYVIGKCLIDHRIT